MCFTTNLFSDWIYAVFFRIAQAQRHYPPASVASGCLATWLKYFKDPIAIWFKMATGVQGR